MRYISRLRLTHFRNYQSAALDLDARHLVLVGPNGAGKTNLLEAISLLAPDRGLRRAPFETLAAQGSDGAWAVAATVETARSEEHTSELQSRPHLVCRLLLEKKKSKQPAPARTAYRPGPAPTAGCYRVSRARPAALYRAFPLWSSAALLTRAPPRHARAGAAV